MLKIGQFSKYTQTTIKTLRYYEKVGLLIPSYVDAHNGYRYYEFSQLPEFNKILAMKQIGFSIDEIKEILDGADLNEYLNRREYTLTQEIIEAKKQQIKIKFMQEKQKSNHDIAIKIIPEYIVCYNEVTLNNFSEVTSFINSTENEINLDSSFNKIEPDYRFMEYLDDEYRERKIKARYSQAITKIGNKNSKLKFKELPSSTVVSVYHKGAYDSFHETYLYVLEYINTHGYEMNGHIRECYINGYWNTANINDWLTEIQIPIKSQR